MIGLQTSDEKILYVKINQIEIKVLMSINGIEI